MKYYFVAKTPTSGFIGQRSIEDIVSQLNANEIKKDYVATESTGLSYAELVKRTDVQWEPVSQLVAQLHLPESAAPQPPESTGGLVTAAPGANFPASLARRYADAYTEAHAVVTIGKVVKGVAMVLFIGILIAGFVMASQSGNRQFGGGEMNALVAGMGFALACLVGIPTYVLGILIAAQGQTSLASLDTAVNSSRHLSDDDVARVLAKRFSL